MADIKKIYQQIQETKKEIREIRKEYKNALQNTQAYVDVTEEMKKLRDQKKQIEEAVKADFQKDFERIDDLKLDVESDQQMLSDIALNKLVKGEMVELTDDNDVRYEPVFSVKFIKSE